MLLPYRADGLDDDEFEEGFYIDLFWHRLFSMSAFMWAILLKDPLYKNTPF